MEEFSIQSWILRGGGWSVMKGKNNLKKEEPSQTSESNCQVDLGARTVGREKDGCGWRGLVHQSGILNCFKRTSENWDSPRSENWFPPRWRGSRGGAKISILRFEGG